MPRLARSSAVSMMNVSKVDPHSGMLSSISSVSMPPRYGARLDRNFSTCAPDGKSIGPLLRFGLEETLTFQKQSVGE
jgi:hypothetical protein